MRWLGNKGPLLAQIHEAALTAGFRGGTVCDLFAGSGSVGRFFRSQGCRVLSTDLMNCSHVFQKAYLESDGPPRFEGLKQHWEQRPPAPLERLVNLEEETGDSWIPFLKLVRYLEEGLPSEEGMLYRQFSVAGEAQRNYLSPENAARLDGILNQLRAWRISEALTENELWILLASCIDAADRVANISGTYGAYLKTMQGSAMRSLELRAPALVTGPVGAAHREDALEWISTIECELLYIDPPYNQRQYPANYHLPEIISLLPFEESEQRLEETIYGKTGLIPWKDKASPLCSRRGEECFRSMRQLLKEAKADIVVFSYSEEGILERSELEKILQDWSGSGGSSSLTLMEIPYRRFRSDAQKPREPGEQKRTFRPAPGRSADEVHEWLFVATRDRSEEAVVDPS